MSREAFFVYFSLKNLKSVRNHNSKMKTTSKRYEYSKNDKLVSVMAIKHFISIECHGRTSLCEFRRVLFIETVPFIMQSL